MKTPLLILVNTISTGDGVLFQASELFSIIWPIMANFVMNSHTFGCTFTGLNNAMVYQNLQISGM